MVALGEFEKFWDGAFERVREVSLEFLQNDESVARFKRFARETSMRFLPTFQGWAASCQGLFGYVL